MPELVFKGKEFVYNHHLTVPYSPILRHPDKSIGSGTLDDNLIVHGDNLLALKALMPRYAGKVDCIFIDPPYNTGNEGWSYNDNVNSPIMREWLTHNPVNAEDMLRHDKWCCMMWPRLRLLYELLAETGSLWMTIDGTEYARARLMLDELFGEGGPGNQANHVATIAWQKRTAPDARVMIDDAFDFLVGYAKSRPDLILYRRPVTDQDRTRFSNPDDDPHGPWASTDLSAQGYRPNQMYSILLPGGREITPPEGRCWSVVEEEYQRLLRDGRVWFLVNGDTGPRVKTYLEESDGFTDWTWWPYGEVGSNETAKKELMAIFGGKSVFETPKPVGVISRLLQLTTDRSALILDSFAGSGTT
ncbi:MAG: site-specific DNA-methyltransferase, partial [Armatimonadetes bacterium]|nr:site-specific DNA-methyltransferase [Armatimonadota bacterium]